RCSSSPHHVHSCLALIRGNEGCSAEFPSAYLFIATDWGSPGNSEFLGLGSKRRGLEAFRGKATLEQLADCRGAAWHALLKPEVVQDSQFGTRKHDLEPLAPTITVCHQFPHCRTIMTLLYMSNLLNMIWFRKGGSVSYCVWRPQNGDFPQAWL